MLGIEGVLAKTLSFKEEDIKKVMKSLSFKRRDSETMLTPKSSGKIVLAHSLSFKKWEQENEKLETPVELKVQRSDSDQPSCISLNGTDSDAETASKRLSGVTFPKPIRIEPNAAPAKVASPRSSSVLGWSKRTSPKPPISDSDPALIILNSPRPICELDAAAVTLQKVYKSYRTRRNLADCAVVVEELWWKALDFASLNRSSVSFFNGKKAQSAVSRWARARTRVAKVGKGLSQDEKAQQLALQHWLEAIDPRHRYGHNLHLYYDIWFDSQSTQPFFYWLDIGDGKEIVHHKCPRTKLQQQCIKYLGPKEREAYEVIVESGKLVYKQSELLVDTVEGSKWIFVLSTSRNLYVGQKMKGKFQHSSFLAGAATTAAGRLVAKDGILKAIWPYSGHYLPTEDNFKEFISFLSDNNVDLSSVQRCSVDDDDFTSFRKSNDDSAVELVDAKGVVESRDESEVAEVIAAEKDEPAKESTEHEKHEENTVDKVTVPEFTKRFSFKWTSPTGPRIGCVRDYPADLQLMALEQVNLSPRVNPSPRLPIPSPRPSPKVRLSPRLAYMGIPSPRVNLTLPTPKRI